MLQMFLLVCFPRDGSTERSRGLRMMGSAVYVLALVSCPCITDILHTAELEAAIQSMILAFAVYIASCRG